ncbi:putative leucine-rich repeat protein (LRRP) [Trypanosoma theileri]|uniref:Putative leucine-rich repeat protein (LRRP) n=1 Tax=Trypanosoma theileri TaxID=67003 RepID=A0A1X0P6K4_9TRYP|nr:putative leucine-rich repeat protein (LRRP) [Trypanosoma theileri]ORC92554.1 putative leucine-rich repeat protein (LRRP) [Trypanosoma theileri]
MSESSGDASSVIVSILPHKPINVFATDGRNSDTSEGKPPRKQQHPQKKQELEEEQSQQQQEQSQEEQQQRPKVSGVGSVHWESAARKKRPPPKWSCPINYQPVNNALMPTPRVCNVMFPSAELLGDPTRTSLLNHTASSSPNWLSGSVSSKNTRFTSMGGVVPQDPAVPLPPNAPPVVSETRRDVFKQSGEHIPRPEARVVHPQGFRILKDRSVIERSLRSYFRLPPAPSTHLKQERRRAQRQLLAVEMSEDAEDARFFSATMEGSLRQPPMASGSMQPRLLLDGFMLLCAGAQPEPEAVEAVTLQCSHLVGVIKDDLTHFRNLRFLDVSENELLLEQLLPLTGLEVLHLAYNKINSLAGVARAVQEQQQQQQLQQKQENSGNGNIFSNRSGIRCSASGVGPNATRNSASIRSAAAYYAKEISAATVTSRTKTTTGTESPPLDIEGNSCQAMERNSFVSGVNSSWSGYIDAGVGYFSPHQKVTGLTQETSECSLHDVLLPNLHALNLSFNSIPPNDVLHLSYFPFLEKLDLSGNNLRVLPQDLAGLTCVTHFALERNHFSDGKSVFAALSTMPALIEVNLNHNELRRVPPLSVRDGHGLCFPTIEVIGLAHNRVETAQDVAALSELVKTLRRVVLAGNPIARKKKEQGEAQALFAQSVMNMYWEQTGISGKDEVEFGSGSPFCTNPLVSTESLPSHFRRYSRHDHQHHHHHHHQQQQQEEEEQEEWRQWHPGEEDIPESEKGEEDYHALDSLVYSWKEQMESKRSLHNQTEYSQESGPLRYSEDDSENDKDNNNERKPRDAPPSNDTNTLSLSFTRDGGAVLNNIIWYGDALPPPQSATPSGKNGKATVPPSSSLLHFVELVFDDVVMQKQKVGYFYAKRRQLLKEEVVGEEQQQQQQQQQGQIDPTQPSRMVHPKTGLVTVPNYNEFMDIYRLLEKSPQTQRPYGKRMYTTTTRRGRKKKPTTNIMVSPDKEKESDEDETRKEEDGTKSTTESMIVETKSQLEESEIDDEEEEIETSSYGSVSSQDVVFMTGVALQEEKKSDKERRKRRRRRRNEEHKNEEEHMDQEEPLEKDELNPDIDTDMDGTSKIEENYQTKSKKQQRQHHQNRSKEYFSTHGKEDQASSYEYEPPSTNVRILMNELRRMLRRPLPALPPLTTTRPTNRSTKGL